MLYYYYNRGKIILLFVQVFKSIKRLNRFYIYLTFHLKIRKNRANIASDKRLTTFKVKFSHNIVAISCRSVVSSKNAKLINNRDWFQNYNHITYHMINWFIFLNYNKKLFLKNAYKCKKERHTVQTKIHLFILFFFFFLRSIIEITI